MPQFSNDTESIFTALVSTVSNNVLQQQLATSQPQPSAGLITTTNPVLPDRLVNDRLAHMDPDIYDLSDSSHLIKLLKVMLGAPGAGGLRKQMSVMRLSNAFSGMHFLDLDRFWGALFGIQRTQAELAPDFTFDPYTDSTDAATWDDLHSRDASYRDRLTKFARSIYFGPTYTGFVAMVQALTGDDCELYESWEWIDEQNAGIGVLPVQNYTYTFLQNTLSGWAQLETKNWGDWGGGTNLNLGRTGQPDRSEFVVQPKKVLGLDEQYELVRVLNTFKPAGSNFTINASGVSVKVPIEIRSVAASSEYWDVTASIIPNQNLQISPYPTQTSPSARPAFSQYQGESWTYNADIASVKSYTMSGEVPTSSNDDETVIYTDNTTHIYSADNAIMTATQASSGKLVADGVLTVSPYAPARAMVST